MIPDEMLNRWQKNAIAGNAALLENLLEFKDEFEGEVKHGDKMELYAEAAPANCLSVSRFRQLYHLVLRYTVDGDNDIAYWLSVGLGWEHLEAAPSLAEQIRRTPKDLLYEAVEMGGKTGKPMSVEEMKSFALGETEKDKIKNGYHIERFIGGLVNGCRKFLGWDDEKLNLFSTRLKKLFDEFEGMHK